MNDIHHVTINGHNFHAYLKEHGIVYLTGEACGLGMRGLYDLNEEGKQFVAELMGGCIPSNRNYNSGASWSCLIPHSVVGDLVVYILSAEWDVVFDVHQSYGQRYVIGVNNDQFAEIRDRIIEVPDASYMTRRRSGTGRNRATNRHEMTGREM